MDTLTVDGVRVFASVPESAFAVLGWATDCLPDSPAAADTALTVSRLFASAVLYSTSGHSGCPVIVSIAIGRGMARIHVIDQGARLKLSQAVPSVAIALASAPRPAAGLTIVRELTESVAEGPDRCLTLRVAGPVRPSPPDGPGDDGMGHEFEAGAR